MSFLSDNWALYGRSCLKKTVIVSCILVFAQILELQSLAFGSCHCIFWGWIFIVRGVVVLPKFDIGYKIPYIRYIQL